MRILRLRSRLLRATSAGLCLALAVDAGGRAAAPGAAERAKALNQQAAATMPRRRRRQSGRAGRRRPPTPPRIIQHIVVRGTQRVEPGTVLTYVSVREGDTYDPPPMSTRR